MLEHDEIKELEQKWNEHNKKRGYFGFSKENIFKFSKIILLNLVIVLILFKGIVWIKNKDEIAALQISQNIENLKQNLQMPHLKNRNEQDKYFKIYPILQPKKAVQNITSIDLNLIGKDNNLTVKKIDYNKTKIINSKFNTSVFQDEVISFKNAPLPPKLHLSTRKNTFKSGKNNGKIIIKTSNLSQNKDSLKNKFNSTNEIIYAIKLAEEAYDRGNYDDAIKWALIANEIDRDNAKSWIIFAKANYKKGRIDDAIFALESFNDRVFNKEVEVVIKSIKEGLL